MNEAQRVELMHIYIYIDTRMHIYLDVHLLCRPRFGQPLSHEVSAALARRTPPGVARGRGLPRRAAGAEWPPRGRQLRLGERGVLSGFGFRVWRGSG